MSNPNEDFDEFLQENGLLTDDSVFSGNCLYSLFLIVVGFLIGVGICLAQRYGC